MDQFLELSSKSRTGFGYLHLRDPGICNLMQIEYAGSGRDNSARFQPTDFVGGKILR
jgi:hypothetical protein